MDSLKPEIWGPGQILAGDDFGARDAEPMSNDRFAQRQDAIHRMNVDLADADSALDGLFSYVGERNSPADFTQQVEAIVRKHRDDAIRHLPNILDREEAEQAFGGLLRRYGRLALHTDLATRVKSRAEGAEQALSRIKAAAVADPDGLPDRFRSEEHTSELQSH